MPDGPQFSIVIPTRDRPKALAACLEACAGQDWPRDCFEVIVVDDSSRVPLESVMAPFRDRLTISMISQRHAGPGPARNAGAALAQGKYLAFTDDDCVPAHDWLRRLAAQFEAWPEALVGGRVINGLPDNIYSAASQAILDMIYDHLNSRRSPKRFFTANNLAAPASHFQALGGFYEHRGEDRDFSDRWLGGGYEMIYAPDAIVYHNRRLDFREFWGIHHRYGRDSYFFHLARSRRTGQGFWFYPLSVVLMLRYPLWRIWRRRALQIGPLMALAKVANLAGFIFEAGGALLGASPVPPPAEEAEQPQTGGQT